MVAHEIRRKIEETAMMCAPPISTVMKLRTSWVSCKVKTMNTVKLNPTQVKDKYPLRMFSKRL